MAITITPSITTWNRVEPRQRSPQVKVSLKAEVRDPLWFLARQWQFGEFRGEDAGSPAWVEVTSRTADLTQWAAGSASGTLTNLPLEPLALAEPHSPDQATRVELGLVFFRLLDEAFGGAPSDAAKGVFRTKVALPVLPVDDKFNPLEESARQLMSMVTGKAPDGVAVLAHAQAGTFPDGLAAADQPLVTNAYTAFKAWVSDVFGQIGTGDPAGWDPQRLDQTLTVKAGPAASPANVIFGQPDSDGTLQWSSFDLQSEASDPLAGVPPDPVLRMQPSHVRFPGMPANRYWDFEESELAFPDVDLEKRDLLKLLFADFALVHGIDWFVVPVTQRIGTLGVIDSVKVRDVFGGTTTIARADDPMAPPSSERWTMFSMARPGSGLAKYNIIPPSVGPALTTGPVLEDVRFARDEMANLAWAIERAVENRVGEPRPGAERDAASGAALTPPTPPATTAPLRYQIESQVPLNWIPLVAVPIAGKAPAIQLQKARVLRPDPSDANGPPVTVPSLGRILNREPYFLPEEELSRAGLRIERVVLRARWKDGSSRLWVTRRRRGGAGETQSGLRFDAALPTAG
jgi:hypothetical protein